MIETLKTSDWFHSAGFPIAVEPRNPQPPFALHNHEFCEIVIVTGGHGLHVTGKESWPIGTGDTFVITGERPHAYRDLEDLSLINILYQPQKFGWGEMDLPSLPGYHALFTLEPAWRESHQFKSRLRLLHRDLVTVIALVEQLERELHAREPGFRCVASAHFLQIVCYLSRCYGRSTHTDSRSLLRIVKAIDHLETNYQDTITVDTLAQLVHMTKRNLHRTFKKALGLSPISYLIRVRVARAAELLQRDDLTISQIAWMVGCDDSNYFSRQFRMVMGISPRSYRRQLPKIRDAGNRQR